MTASNNPFEAKWSAQGHTLCLGHWDISYEGLSLSLPGSIAENHMNTQGIFSWLFPDDEELTEGDPLETWVDNNADWLLGVFEQADIPLDESHVVWFYQAVNQADWRCGSCGGCM